MSDPIGTKLSKTERKKLIDKVSIASGIARYALETKTTDAELLRLVDHLEILELTKSATNYNRHCQSQKTYTANRKLRDFLAAKKDDFYKLGQWLTDALTKSGKDRQQALLTQNLVHKDEYNDAVSDLTDVVKTQKEGVKQQYEEAAATIKTLEVGISTLRRQLASIERYITIEYGDDEWSKIEKSIKSDRK